MKFSVSQENLKTAVSIVSKAIPARPTHPILSHFLLTLDKENQFLKLTAFNLNTLIQYKISAYVEDGGTFAVPAQLFSSIILLLPSCEIQISFEDESLTVKTLSGEFKIPCLDASEYPKPPELIKENLIELDSSVLHSGLRSTLFCASKDETKQVLTGINIKSADNSICFAATDGHRLSVTEIESNLLTGLELTIPSSVVSSIDSLLLKEKVDTVTMAMDDDLIQFSTENLLISCRRLQGAYPQYRGLIPVAFDKTLTVNRRSFISAVELVSVVADQKNGLVNCTLGQDGTVVEASNTALGNGSQSLDSTLAGEPMKVAFNASYLLDGLKNLSGENVVINMNGSTQPVVIKGDNEGSGLYLIMPVQIREY